MRKLHTIVLHCSASDNDKDDNVQTIDRWHKARGFDGIGYHYYINKDGVLFKGRDLKRDGAHVKGFNKGTIGVCLAGLTEFGQDQFNTCSGLITALRSEHGNLDVVPHRTLCSQTKTCPVFDMMEIYRRLM